MTSSKPENKKVPTYCFQCVSGPDLIKVEVENGVAVRIEPNLNICGQHPGQGTPCVKAYGLVQKTYNPNRVSQPMKRTNPKKGRNEDPGFVPISWDEALDTVAAKMKEIRAKGLKDNSGYPRLAVSFGGGGTPTRFMGSFPAVLAAWGPADLGFGAGQGVKCYHSEHLYGELWQRAFTLEVDSPYCEYVINCGKNVDASGGATGVRRGAEARRRGLKRVMVEPHLSVTGAMSAEWVPIKAKTDAAFLFAVIHRIIKERDWAEVCDVRFLKEDTTSPYLVGPNGYYMREPSTEKPLIWDRADGQAKPFDANIEDPALDGCFKVTGLELGADEEAWRHDGVEVKPAFQVLLDHMEEYTPDWAEAECDVPAETIRRVGDEFVAHARVGEMIEIEGEMLPLRPVGVALGKSVNNGPGGYHAVWARTLLSVLVGAIEVPGSNLGTKVRLNRPANNKHLSAISSRDGIMDFPFNDTSKEGWSSQPRIRNGYNSLVPLSSSSPWAPALGPAHLPWLFQKKAPDNWPRPTLPDMWICYRTNPAISSWNAPEIAERIAEFPFTLSFAYTRDETNHMADIVLPEATDLESLQLSRIGGTGSGEQFWKHQGWMIRQPAVEPVVDAMDMTDIATEICQRVGILGEYNMAINKGAAGMKLVNNQFDYSLDGDVAYGVEEIWDRIAKAASHDLSNGEEVHDLAWFKENGYMLRDFAQREWYLYPYMKDRGIRFELPYQERIKRHGVQLANRLHEVGVEWWDGQLEDYDPLPKYESFPEIWTNYVREMGKEPDDYPFWALTARSMQYAWGANVGLPLIYEVAENVAGHSGIVMNMQSAQKMGINQGDPVVIESATGITHGNAVLRHGIRPDTVLMIGQFDHWATPFAKDLNLPSLNSVTDIALSLTDGTGSGSDIVRVKISKDLRLRRTGS
ncbi:MAG: molybdopterin-dependent oxidoreductase [Alphaproteobacteria bacterium]|nr:molybdopterin-dependent oxidoreductase [Alphaproteobacteria bacterium]MDP6257125.1 molybdopterin-dependent oxidoreductase [Alphaproteobacteria bacterium]MDP7053526.1 molybdopterin-dependent oxidoreductase [Alphaproteobacteria bacterium]MDP7230118.1 molybdopterin-dependent oxidoreductase [Alphaproteobacteria bacterium]MDP7459533.1 molybdopterin-dependent oxidoreductase [Alphaproteobacteria bacterium]